MSKKKKKLIINKKKNNISFKVYLPMGIIYMYLNNNKGSVIKKEYIIICKKGEGGQHFVENNWHVLPLAPSITSITILDHLQEDATFFLYNFLQFSSSFFLTISYMRPISFFYSCAPWKILWLMCKHLLYKYYKCIAKNEMFAI